MRKDRIVLINTEIIRFQGIIKAKDAGVGSVGSCSAGN